MKKRKPSKEALALQAIAKLVKKHPGIALQLHFSVRGRHVAADIVSALETAATVFDDTCD